MKKYFKKLIPLVVFMGLIFSASNSPAGRPATSQEKADAVKIIRFFLAVDPSLSFEEAWKNSLVNINNIPFYGKVVDINFNTSEVDSFRTYYNSLFSHVNLGTINRIFQLFNAGKYDEIKKIGGPEALRFLKKYLRGRSPQDLERLKAVVRAFKSGKGAWLFPPILPITILPENLCTDQYFKDRCIKMGYPTYPPRM